MVTPTPKENDLKLANFYTAQRDVGRRRERTRVLNKEMRTCRSTVTQINSFIATNYEKNLLFAH
jgi:hypothetical protein